MQAQDIRFPQQHIQLHTSRRRGLTGTAGNHDAHVERRLRTLRHGATERAVADDSQHPAGQLADVVIEHGELGRVRPGPVDRESGEFAQAMRMRQYHGQHMLHHRAAAVVAHIADRHGVIARRFQINVVGARRRDTDEPQLRIRLDERAGDVQLVGEDDLGSRHPRRNLRDRRDIVQHDVGEYALERAHVKIAIADGGEIKEYGFDCHGPHYTGMFCFGMGSPAARGSAVDRGRPRSGG